MTSVRVQIDTADLLRFVRVMDSVERGVHTAVSDALNEVGDSAVREAITSISKDTGLDYSVAQRFVTAKRATPDDKSYQILVKHGLIEQERVTRSLPRRQFPGQESHVFDERTLVNVKTAGDDNVCPICKRIEEEGPYDPGEIGRLRAMHPHFLSPELGCRCATIPFRSRRRLETRQRFGRGAGVERTTTMRQLSDTIRKNLKTTLRVK